MHSHHSGRQPTLTLITDLDVQGDVDVCEAHFSSREAPAAARHPAVVGLRRELYWEAKSLLSPGAPSTYSMLQCILLLLLPLNPLANCRVNIIQNAHLRAHSP